MAGRRHAGAEANEFARVEFQQRVAKCPTVEQIDLAANLSRLAAKSDQVARKARVHAAGMVLEWATPEGADDLAAVLDETARQVRLNRPHRVVDSAS
ncbi:MAG: hypothetical protein ACREOF_12785 [Gemmatimonadales bacterium]